MNVKTESKAVQNLLTSLQRRMASKQNIDGYLLSVKQFCEFIDKSSDQVVNEIKEGKVNVQKVLQDFTDNLTAKGLAPKTVRRAYYQLQKFFRSNDIKIEAKSVELPIARTVYEDRATKREEIKLLLKTGDLRQRTLVLLMSSSGIRVGSISYLKLKHLEKWEEPSTTTPIALNIPSEASKGHVPYVTFVSQESYEAIQDYLNYRRKYGEAITEETHLIRDTFEAKPNGACDPEPLSSYGVKTLFQRMFAKYLRDEKRKRHEVKTTHGFRKFFRTALDSAGIPVGASEALMGHSAGLITVYVKHTLEELRNHYSKAVPHLTIEKVVASELDIAKASALAQLRDKLSPEAYATIEPIILQAKHTEEINETVDKYRTGKLERIRSREETEDCQQIVTEKALAEYLKKHWHVVCVLPSGKVVINNE